MLRTIASTRADPRAASLGGRRSKHKQHRRHQWRLPHAAIPSHQTLTKPVFQYLSCVGRLLGAPRTRASNLSPPIVSVPVFPHLYFNVLILEAFVPGAKTHRLVREETLRPELFSRNLSTPETTARNAGAVGECTAWRWRAANRRPRCKSAVLSYPTRSSKLWRALCSSRPENLCFSQTGSSMGALGVAFLA